MHHDNSTAPGDPLRGFVEAAADDLRAQTPEQEREQHNAARSCGLDIIEAGGVWFVMGYGRTFYTSRDRRACLAYCTIAGPCIEALADAGELKTPPAQ